DEKAHVHRWLGQTERLGEELASPLGTRCDEGARLNTRLPLVDRRDQEIVFVNACEPELSFLNRLIAHFTDGDPFDLAGSIQDQLRWSDGRAAIEETRIGRCRCDVSRPWTPRDGRIDHALTISRVDRERHDVGGRLESKFL